MSKFAQIEETKSDSEKNWNEAEPQVNNQVSDSSGDHLPGEDYEYAHKESCIVLDADEPILSEVHESPQTRTKHL